MVNQARRLKELETENIQLKKTGGRSIIGQSHPKEDSAGKILSPVKRSQAVEYICEKLGISERRT